MAETKQAKGKGFGLVYFLLIVLGFSLYYNQWVTLEKLSNAVNPIAQFGTFSQFFGFLNQYGSRIFSSSDAFFTYLIIAICIILIFMEVRKKTFTDLSETLPRMDRHLILYLFIIALFCMRYYFAIGKDMYNGDAAYFFYLVSRLTESFKSGVFFPYWTNIHGGGAPINQFYGPLHSYVAALFNMLSGNIHFSVKLSLFLFHLMSAIGVYLFIRELFSSKKAGFMAGIATILMYYHPHLIIFPGRYGEGAIWAFYPFLFYFFERYIASLKKINIVLLALTVGALILSSIGMSYYFFLFWGIYAATRLLVLEKHWKDKFIIFAMVALGVIGGFFLSSYYLYSQIFETQWSIADLFSKGKTAAIEPHLIPPIFVWNNFQVILFDVPRVWQSAYFGVTLLLLAFVGIVESVRKREKRAIPLVVMAALIIILFISYGRVQWLNKIPYLQTYSQSRLLNIMAFATIFLSGVGALALLSWFKKRGLFMLILIFIFIDLFPTTFHDTWAAQYAGSASGFFSQLKSQYGFKKNKLADFRVELLGKNSRIVQNNWRAYDAFMAETGVPLIKESMWDSKQWNLFANGLDNLAYYLDPRLSIDVLLNHCYIYNCKYVISSFALPQQVFKSYVVSSDVVMAELPFHSPVLFTTKLEKMDYTTNLYASYLTSLKIDPVKRTVNHMWLNRGNSAILPDLKRTNELISHLVYNHKVVMKLKVIDESFAIFSYSAYPTTRLFVNGKRTEFMETVQGSICIRLPPGEFDIVLKSSRTRTAFLSLILACILSVLIIVYLVFEYRKKSKERKAL